MNVIEFSDILYGKIYLPEWIIPFLRTPEFVRLRGVRLSNVDSFQFKDFNGPTRWEHSISVASLALRCAEKRSASQRDLIHLALAALYHDVATPPFAHTLEHVLEGFNHESESQRILRAETEGDVNPAVPVFASQLPQFQRVCEKVSKQLNICIDPDEVSRLVVGDGEMGFLINGTLDLDNADNVTRASLHLGIEVDRKVPLGVADWLATQDGVPLNLGDIEEEAVVKWLQYRQQMYAAFFESSSDELGRQAFLQHLARKALLKGVPRSKLIWNTDEGFLNLLEASNVAIQPSEESEFSLRELVQRYRLFEPTSLIAEVPIEDADSLRLFNSPVALNWIEKQMAGHAFEPFVFVNARRYFRPGAQDSLFPPAPGSLLIFKLGQSAKTKQLPEWLRKSAPLHLTPQTLRRFLTESLRKNLSIWVQEKPWLNLTNERKSNIKENLNAVGDWSFRLSRNEMLHSYPSTFVHAIPAALINTLGLRGEVVVDTFGGTGQTAIEAIKAGGTGVTADVNSVAVLIAKTKLTYLDSNKRRKIKTITTDEIANCEVGDVPQFDLIEKWHHPTTLQELCRIRYFIQNTKDAAVAQFLRATFSSVLSATTARKGKQHGFFADNTPLAKTELKPQYENALDLFVAKLSRNLEIVQRMYSTLERKGRNPAEELKRGKAFHVDVTKAVPEDYGLKDGGAAGIITSPPYLCMSDYSLGQRLSYYWLFPKKMQDEHLREVGARRRRNQAETAMSSYLADYEKFAQLSARLLRPGGFLATILGAPVAEAFKDARIMDKTDEVLLNAGFKMFWSTWRPIQWHRNHGYARLKEERIAVYTLSK